MLSIFKDAPLALVANVNSPKRFLLPLKGGSVSSSLFMGDPYTCTVTAQAVAAATSLSLDQTFELTTPGVLTIGAQTISYLTKTATGVAGIPTSGAGSIASTINAGTVAVPKLVYASTSTLRVDPNGTDATPDISLQLKRSNQTSYNFPNTPALYSQTTINSGVANAVEVDLQVNAKSGLQQEFLTLSLVGNTMTCAENLAPFSEQFDQWAGSAVVTANTDVAPDGNTTADTLNDNSATTFMNRSFSLTIPADTTTYLFSIFVKKTSVATNTFGFNLAFANGTAKSATPRLNTNSGVIINFLGTNGDGTGAVIDAGNYWIMWTALPNNGTNTAITVSVQPATGTNSGTQPGSDVAATTGTAVVWGACLARVTTPSVYIPTTSLFQPGRNDVVTLSAPLYIFRRDQALPQALRLFPATRQVNAALPGFVLGQYRWRDQDTINETTIVPTQWDQDPTVVGLEKFSSGIGHGDDLSPQGLIEQNDSIFMQVNRGSYFTGPVRHYLPATKNLEFFPVSGPATLTLAAMPTAQTPVFVGTWKLDTQGYYESDTEYRYMSSGLSADPAAPLYQYTINRRTQTVAINQAPPQKILFLGTISGQSTDYFDLPSYPVDRINRVYIDRGLSGQALDSTSWLFDRNQGTVTLSNQQLSPNWTRIQTTGGTATPKYVWNGPTSNNGDVVHLEVKLTNNGLTAVSVGSNYGPAGGPANQVVQPGKSALVVYDGVVNTGPRTIEIFFATANIGDALDVTAADPSGTQNGVNLNIPRTFTGTGWGVNAGSTATLSSVVVSASIPGALVGEAVLAVVDLAVAVEYETSDLPTMTVSTVDLNPAFSGLTGGYFYLQHRRQKADTIQLTVDKPVIAIPPTHDTIVGLTAYGPVYFNGDYAMLIAKAFSKTPGETVPNAQMKAILDPTTFTGLLNYRNPVASITAATRANGVATYTAINTFQAGDNVTITALSDATFNGVFTVVSATNMNFTVNMGQPSASINSQSGFAVIDIVVTSGGDGTASLIYIPQSGFGVWVPTSAAQTPIAVASLGGVKTTTIANDTLVLPTPIPISQLRNNKEGWLVTLYSILNNDPFFGLVGANTALGQIPFTTQGTPGSAGYKTNGERSPWTSGSGGSAPILPIHALDINGVDYTVGGFTGSVKQLQFGQSLPTPTGLAAYFISFVQRITVQLQAIGTNVQSPPVLLQMAVPDVIVQNPWLRLEDDAQGRINQFRLGWVKSTPLFGPTR